VPDEEDEVVVPKGKASRARRQDKVQKPKTRKANKDWSKSKRKGTKKPRVVEVEEEEEQEEEEHPCPACSSSFKKERHLEQHCKDDHTGMHFKLFKCNKCGDKFSTVSNRNIHQNVCGVPLADRKKWECNKCGKKYRSNRARNNHQKVCGVSKQPKQPKQGTKAAKQAQETKQSSDDLAAVGLTRYQIFTSPQALAAFLQMSPDTKMYNMWRTTSTNSFIVHGWLSCAATHNSSRRNPSWNSGQCNSRIFVHVEPGCVRVQHVTEGHSLACLTLFAQRKAACAQRILLSSLSSAL
jgi:DNA-directed RNA polymerase subunit RPC12/RpoP